MNISTNGVGADTASVPRRVSNALYKIKMNTVSLYDRIGLQKTKHIGRERPCVHQ